MLNYVVLDLCNLATLTVSIPVDISFLVERKMDSSLAPSLERLKLPSGGFAMLAIDQRESMRQMFAEKQAAPVSDQQISDFKINALRALSPIASAVLIDRLFAWPRALDEGAVAPGCGLIAAADTLRPSGDELIGEVEIDEEIDFVKMRASGVEAMKLLVIWRPDEPASKRIALVDDFIARCRAANILSLIEPVSRKRRDGRECNLNDGVILAAEELGKRGADIYKSEVPFFAKASESEVRAQCAQLRKAIDGPWVVLSSGVDPERFPIAVEWACREGAAGFLAGRAVWRSVIGEADVARALQEVAVPRLERLCEVVARVVKG